MEFLRRVLPCVLVFTRFTSAQIDEDLVLRYITEPDISPPRLDVHFSNSGLLAPGFLFVTPWHTTEVDCGPYIYDSQGRLVWSGTSSTYGSFASDLHVCQFQSEPSLCFFEGQQKLRWGKGRGAILNSQYRRIATVESMGRGSFADMHEFQLIDDGTTALVMGYVTVPFDGAAVGFKQGFSWILNNHVQEVDVATGEVKFDWNALDHVDPVTSPVAAGFAGVSRLYQMDFFHVNSISKTFDGDYIISSRSMDTIYKISHEDGHIIWRLGGNFTDFEADFSFCQQHHARIQTESPGKLVLSLFDNGCTDASAKVVEVDERTMKATLLQEQGGDRNMIIESQGSTEILQNGNVLIGWGSQGRITEHTKAGTLVFNATFSGATHTYRAYKSEWHAVPKEDPRLFAYSKQDGAKTVLYVSWNGATEVSYWHFYGRNSETESFRSLGTATKDGFETMYESDEHITTAYAEAHSQDGLSLRRSNIKQTFIPSEELARFCTELSCPWDTIKDQ